MSGIGEEKKTTEFDNTMEALRRAQSVLPDFSSSYDREIRRLYDEIVNRPAFRYDPVNDPLYQSYRTQMVTEGQRAMRDTVGQASSLTGGYGSSYAQSVGQQEYELYLQRLGQVMPQLYKAAWERYSAEGDELKNLFDTSMSLRQDEAGRERDRFNQALQLEQQAYQREQDRLDRETAREQQSYQREQTSYAQTLAREKLDYERGEKDYQKLVNLIGQSGYMPSDAELSAAGMSRDQAQALRSNYLMKNPMALALSGGLPALLSGTSYTGGAYTGGSGSAYTGGSGSSGGSARTGTKEQIKLGANQKGSSSGGKQRRL